MPRALTVVLLICVLAAQGCTVFDDPAAEAEASAAAAAAAAPRECPAGFARALKPKSYGVLSKTMNPRSSSKEVPPESLPLPKVLTSKIVCAVRQENDDFRQVIAIMRADLSYEDVRHALWDADFDSGGRDAVYVRSSFVPYGDIEAALTLTYGSSPTFAPVENLFPPATQVAFFSIRSKPLKSKPQPPVPSLADLETGTVGFWSCGWSPTINSDWHDDVLCTNGTRQKRPYLLPNDSFVTRDEIMRAANEYERHLNGE